MSVPKHVGRYCTSHGNSRGKYSKTPLTFLYERRCKSLREFAKVLRLPDKTLFYGRIVCMNKGRFKRKKCKCSVRRDRQIKDICFEKDGHFLNRLIFDFFILWKRYLASNVITSGWICSIAELFSLRKLFYMLPRYCFFFYYYLHLNHHFNVSMLTVYNYFRILLYYTMFKINVIY